MPLLMVCAPRVNVRLSATSKLPSCEVLAAARLQPKLATPVMLICALPLEQGGVFHVFRMLRPAQLVEESGSENRCELTTEAVHAVFVDVAAAYGAQAAASA